MKVVFRTDASMQIGTGHVMRCLTLARALTAKGAECQFICRSHEGSLIEVIRQMGFIVNTIPIYEAPREASTADKSNGPPNDHLHSLWLGATQEQDAEASAPTLETVRPDWLVVDHYALDANWENALAPYCRKLMVIDDLADRSHICDLLLDQTLGRDARDYQPLVPATCRLLCGSKYALLRPEFSALRATSLQRRKNPVVRELLVNMGGVDNNNATGQVLRALSKCHLPADCRITVVMGGEAPWLSEVRAQARGMPGETRVVAGIRDMGQVMANSDIAFGAAGTTSWERCCLGLPTIMVVLAENQRKIARELESVGAAMLIKLDQITTAKSRARLSSLFNDIAQLRAMSACAANLVDGLGPHAVIQRMEA